MEGQLVNGGDCPSVLCQEFLKGTEYVVDHVSRDGVHKTCMIWVYDKRVANGANFVYFGMKPVDPSTPLASILINYTRRVLDAMQILHGPSHGEVMMTEDGPCLVEMNCRAHGGDGTFARKFYLNEYSWEKKFKKNDSVLSKRYCLTHTLFDSILS